MQIKPQFPSWASSAKADILGVPMDMWGQFGVRAMPTLKAYNGGQDCGEAHPSGSQITSKLDSCR